MQAGSTALEVFAAKMKGKIKKTPRALSAAVVRHPLARLASAYRLPFLSLLSYKYLITTKTSVNSVILDTCHGHQSGVFPGSVNQSITGGILSLKHLTRS